MEKIVVKNLVENGKHFCVLPWVHFHAWPDKRVMPCCVADSELTPLTLVSQTAVAWLLVVKAPAVDVIGDITVATAIQV